MTPLRMPGGPDIVIALSPGGVPRQLRKIGSFGLTRRLARILPLGLSAAESMDEEKTFGRMVEIGKTLREAHGADVIVMGCAGMARFRGPLQEAVGIPVVEPTQAAVGMAIARVTLNWAGL